MKEKKKEEKKNTFFPRLPSLTPCSSNNMYNIHSFELFNMNFIGIMRAHSVDIYHFYTQEFFFCFISIFLCVIKSLDKEREKKLLLFLYLLVARKLFIPAFFNYLVNILSYHHFS